MSSFERTDQDEPTTTERERIAGLVGLAIGEAQEKGRVNLGQYADAILGRLRQSPDELRRREIALQHAVASQRGPESGPELVAKAEPLLAFLRGDAPSREAQEDVAWKAAGQ